MKYFSKQEKKDFQNRQYRDALQKQYKKNKTKIKANELFLFKFTKFTTPLKFFKWRIKKMIIQDN